jgi:nucleoside-diphosphate-sugar epimerase
MTKHAVVLGGGGFIGRFVSEHLLAAGWEVTVAGLGAPETTRELGQLGARLTNYDRADTASLLRCVGDGVDCFVDIIPYCSEHAHQLQVLEGRIGGLVALSSAATYVDDCGRQLMAGYDYTMQPGAEAMAPTRITEDQPQMAPDETSYPGGKVAFELAICERPPAPVTILRPFAVSGPRNNGPREWWIVKRIRDRRPLVVLAQHGREHFNRTSVGNLAELVRLAADQPGHRILNAADDDQACVLDLVRQVASSLDWVFHEVLLPGWSPMPGIADTPWSGPASLSADMTRAERELAYVPITDVDQTLVETLDWIERDVPTDRWQRQLPGYVQRYAGDLTFSYDLEDHFIRELPNRSGTP